MAFLVMHALGVSVPSCLLEHKSFDKALRLVQIAKTRNIPMYYPDDFWCVNNNDSKIVEVFPSDEIIEGWTPMDLGPMSLKRISDLLSNCKVYPFDLDWYNIFENPTQPLIVDIGSGNGLFLLNMAKNWNHSNFLGLEINDKLVKRCQRIILESNQKNVNFISTDATSSFRSILSQYPGELVLVSIQCPIPDFNREEHRWRMVRRILVEDITDLLIVNGKVFLQSDIEDVALRMKGQFIKYGKEKLILEGGDEEGWLPDNPFGVRSDWEQHVIDRGDAMYRLMFKKVGSNSSQ